MMGRCVIYYFDHLNAGALGRKIESNHGEIEVDISTRYRLILDSFSLLNVKNLSQHSLKAPLPYKGAAGACLILDVI